MWVIGVDPGGAHTGIVLREGDVLCGQATLHSADFPAVGGLPGPTYLGAVLSHIAMMMALALRGDPDEQRLIAVEGLSKPSPYIDGRRASLSPMTLVATGVVYGAVLGRWPSAIVVPPGKNGQALMQAYPVELRPTRGRGAGTDALRHVRSAWDVAYLGGREAARMIRARERSL